MNLLEVRALSKSYRGFQAVAGVTFDVEAGELFAVIGPNGAGKTTCFNLINGQLRPDAGSVKLLGREIAGLPPHRVWALGVGRTFQNPSTFHSLTVLENAQVALQVAHRRHRALLPRAEGLFAEEALALLERVGMADHSGQRCAALAYGDLKRVELAMAMAGAPKLLLMDEPTAGMAATEREALMALVARIAREEGTSVLFIEHDLDIVFNHAHRVLVLNRGRVIACGAPRAVREDAQVQASYLSGGAAPTLDRSAGVPPTLHGGRAGKVEPSC